MEEGPAEERGRGGRIGKRQKERERGGNLIRGGETKAKMERVSTD